MYKALGLSSGQTLLVQGIYGAVGPIANILYAFGLIWHVFAQLTCNYSFIILILDTVGRKKPLMFGAGSFVCTYSVLTAIVASFPPEVNGQPNPNTSAQRAGIAMIFMTSIFFSLSFGPVSWVLASEVFPTKTRAMGTAVATVSAQSSVQAYQLTRSMIVCKLGFQRTVLSGFQYCYHQHRLEVLSRIHLLELRRLLDHHVLLPRDQRYLELSPYSIKILTTFTKEKRSSK